MEQGSRLKSGRRFLRSGNINLPIPTGHLEAPVSRRRQAEVVARYGRDTRYHLPA
jgi:hypothetical protein